MMRLFAAILLGMLVCTPAWAGQKSVELTASIPAHEWNSTRLQNVYQGSTLNFELTSDEEIRVLLLDKEGFQKYPQIDRALFQSVASHEIKFSVITPKSGDYYLVVDNTAGDLQVHYLARIEARTNVMAEKSRPWVMAHR
ncbi:exported hypothetical protein [Nitrospina gracilis 3/211]|uniref:Peptidase C-terminal archaeal/bacterial domain-containing protein n=1 Tax=Nitrospina gracilis (strain 3/211) TaxID=1266370 RepID=M1YYX7_NITG3|nr:MULTISPECIES: hypothetical protein [Nitrospina]MCF8723587.1 hypothetical protein [Nitrospina sp. Nb-3]CCQ90661.1 exported hypothetical protein [Nitrospina gracilis 3/211]